MKVRIVQLLCPERHCILAAAYQSPDGEAKAELAETVEEAFRKLTEEKSLNPWCDLCRSQDLHTEDAPTRFTTLAEAAPFLAEAERKQKATRAYLKASKG